jgi:hypothetical protein
VKPGDLIKISLPPGVPQSARRIWSGKLGFVLREGSCCGLPVFWIHVPGVGTASFEPGSLRLLP